MKILKIGESFIEGGADEEDQEASALYDEGRGSGRYRDLSILLSQYQYPQVFVSS